MLLRRKLRRPVSSRISEVSEQQAVDEEAEELNEEVVEDRFMLNSNWIR